MIRIMVVDDEAAIREGIQRHTDWEALGFSVPLLAANGTEAEERFREYLPEVVVSDIRMPDIDGLELIRRLKEIKQTTVFIVISGHDEFAYAQKAISLGAFDYILKPIDTVYLEEKLVHAAAKAREHELRATDREISTKAQVRAILTEATLYTHDIQSLYSRLNALAPHLMNWYYQIAIIDIDHYYRLIGGQENPAGNPRALLRGAIDHGIIGDLAIYRVSESDHGSVLCCCGSTRDELGKQLSVYLDSIRSRLRDESFTVTIGLGGVAVKLDSLNQSFNDAKQALESRYILGHGRIIRIEDVEQLPSACDEDSPEELVCSLIELLGNQAEAERATLLSRLEISLSSSADPRIALHHVMSLLYREINHSLTKLEIPLSQILDDPNAEYREILSSGTVTEAVEMIGSIIARVSSFLRLRENFRSEQLIDRSMRFIDQNLSDPTLDLERTAEVACMSPSYFSVFFKKHAGETFSRYLSKQRIEKAKDLLLSSDAKLYEIGERVGFESSSYFSVVFKKSEGMSPSEYRKIYG